jgi:hypothetical protein
MRENHYWMVNLEPRHEGPIVTAVTRVLDRVAPLAAVALIGTYDQDTEGFITIRVCVNGRDPVELRFDAGRFASIAEEGRRLESALANQAAPS